MKRKLLAGALCSALAGAALAQSIATFNLTGNEVVLGQAGGPGGGSIFIPTYVLRNGQNTILAATGTTVTTVIPNTAGIVLSTGAITTWVVDLPLVPYDGQTVQLSCAFGTVGTLTLAASATMVGTIPTGCGSVASGTAWVYNSSNTAWYRYK